MQRLRLSWRSWRDLTPGGRPALGLPGVRPEPCRDGARPGARSWDRPREHECRARSDVRSTSPGGDRFRERLRDTMERNCRVAQGSFHLVTGPRARVIDPDRADRQHGRSRANTVTRGPAIGQGPRSGPWSAQSRPAPGGLLAVSPYAACRNAASSRIRPSRPKAFDSICRTRSGVIPSCRPISRSGVGSPPSIP